MSKRLRVTSRVSKRGRSLRPRSIPPRSPTSSAPPEGDLDFDSTAADEESLPPPEAEEDERESDSPASDDATPLPLHAQAESRLPAEDEHEAQNEPDEAAQTSPSEDMQASAPEQDTQASPSEDEPRDEPAGFIEPAPASTDAFSGEFFRKETDSVPPSVDASRAEADDAAMPGQLSPQAIAYQARLRKIVAGVVAGMGVLALAVAGKALLSPPRASAPPVRSAPASVEVALPQPAAPLPVPAAKPAPATTQEVAAKPDTSAPPETAPPPDPASSAAAPEAAADAKAAEAPAVDIVALKKETENLMNRGKFKDAIEKARVAVAADPSDALPYLYLGSSLQETGKWKEGVEAYSECVRQATKGPIHECRAMGGRK